VASDTKTFVVLSRRYGKTQSLKQLREDILNRRVAWVVPAEAIEAEGYDSTNPALPGGDDD